MPRWQKTDKFGPYRLLEPLTICVYYSSTDSVVLNRLFGSIAKMSAHQRDNHGTKSISVAIHGQKTCSVKGVIYAGGKVCAFKSLNCGTLGQ